MILYKPALVGHPEMLNYTIWRRLFTDERTVY